MRCSWELNNLFLRAVSSALGLRIGPFGWVHILVLSDLKIWRPSNKMFETLKNRLVCSKKHLPGGLSKFANEDFDIKDKQKSNF